VWSASDEAGGHTCALKFLRAELSGTARLKLRFLREALVASQVDHPGIARVLDVAEDEQGAVFIAFERLDGATLASALRVEPTMPTRLFVDLVRQLAAVLAATHAASIVHRDLKPANLFLHRSKEGGIALKLIDFGVSKVGFANDGLRTQTGSFLGSPRYVSPEQVLATAGVDARADLWSVAVILFEGLTGRHPHQAADVGGLLLSIAKDPPASVDALRPDLPASLRAVVRDCLKPRLSRIASAKEIQERLGAVLAAHEIPADSRLPAPGSLATLDAETEAAPVPETLGSITEVWQGGRTA
jgi:serine/threonine-protein kinase